MKMDTHRFTTVCAILLFSLTLAACGGDDDGNNGSNGTDTGMADTSNGGDGEGMAVQEVSCPDSPAETVSMTGTTYMPAAVTVSPGDIVMWSNDEPAGVTHTVTSGRDGDEDSGSLFNSGDVAQGETYCLQFDSTGEYQYWCEYHPNTMNNGVVTVE